MTRTLAAVVDAVFERNVLIVQRTLGIEFGNRRRLLHLFGLSRTDQGHGHAEQHGQQDKTNLLEEHIL